MSKNHTQAEWRRTCARAGFYLKGAARQITPGAILRRRMLNLLDAFQSHPDRTALEARARYYNRLSQSFQIDAPRLRDIPFKRSRYFFDLMEHTLGFGRDRRITALFGDITYVPDTPAIVKSRPIGPDNARAVLLPLDKLRHFQSLNDPIPFADKRPTAVWRGTLNNPQRITLIERFSAHSDHDIGHTGGVVPHAMSPKPFLTKAQQLQHQFLLSIEGNDVATNLKWLMSSNSLVFAPPMRYETWYMEGALQPETHFVGVAPDFSNLEEKIAFYRAHPEAAETIIANAQAWRAQFNDPKREAMIATRVLEIYFQLSGQL